MQACSKPEAKFHRLNDTCSACHPAFLLAQINKEHESIRGEFLSLLGGARSTKERLEIQRCIHQNEQARRDKIAEVQKMSWSGAVDWGAEEGEKEKDGEKE
jgi:hypothetical protein